MSAVSYPFARWSPTLGAKPGNIVLGYTQRAPLIGQALIDTVGRKPTCEGIILRTLFAEMPLLLPSQV